MMQVGFRPVNFQGFLKDITPEDSFKIGIKALKNNSPQSIMAMSDNGRFKDLKDKEGAIKTLEEIRDQAEYTGIKQTCQRIIDQIKTYL